MSPDLNLRGARRFGVEALSALVGGPDWQESLRAFVEKPEQVFAPSWDGDA